MIIGLCFWPWWSIRYSAHSPAFPTAYVWVYPKHSVLNPLKSPLKSFCVSSVFLWGRSLGRTWLGFGVSQQLGLAGGEGCFTGFLGAHAMRSTAYLGELEASWSFFLISRLLYVVSPHELMEEQWDCSHDSTGLQPSIHEKLPASKVLALP